MERRVILPACPRDVGFGVTLGAVALHLAAPAPALPARFLGPTLTFSVAGRAFDIPLVPTLLGVGMVAGGFRLAAAGREELSRAATPIRPGDEVRALVSRGIYARTRNPLYLSLLLIAGGGAVLTNSLWGAGAVAGLFLYLSWVIGEEEKLLSSMFGEQFKAYCESTPRWF
jgi:protein-S-isoprenylcysteine O-methyltransferase Ste14